MQSNLESARRGQSTAGVAPASRVTRGAGGRFVLLDDKGPLTEARRDLLNPQQQNFVRADMKAGASLLEVVADYKPSLLLGLSASPGIFTKEVCPLPRPELLDTGPSWATCVGCWSTSADASVGARLDALGGN